ncbi:hypothetical protein C8T65DRAFT_641902 [Cerioporus squamosus]|nr:hypothetical protein C8T65DRAFT_641902 [Cerioporus squamosus]
MVRRRRPLCIVAAARLGAGVELTSLLPRSAGGLRNADPPAVPGVPRVDTISDRGGRVAEAFLPIPAEAPTREGASRAPRGPCQLRPPIVRRIWVAGRPLSAASSTRRVYSRSSLLAASFSWGARVRTRSRRTARVNERTPRGGLLFVSPVRSGGFWAARTRFVGAMRFRAVRRRTRSEDLVLVASRRGRVESCYWQPAAWVCMTRARSSALGRTADEYEEGVCARLRGPVCGMEQGRRGPYSLAATSGR